MSNEDILLAMKGLVAPEEGRVLAKMAGTVNPDHEIVEVGSHRGLSSCWILSGSLAGSSAHVTCIDPWPEYGAVDEHRGDIEWGENGALEQWFVNVAAIGGSHLATPLRSTAARVAEQWAKPVGMFFHDAGHAYDEVANDYLSWLPYFTAGMWVAIHDYYGNRSDGKGGWERDPSLHHQQAIDDVILPSGLWDGVQVIAATDGSALPNLWIGRWFPR